MNLLSGLTAYFKMDGDSRSSRGSYNGTDTDIVYSPGKINQGAFFNGSSSEIALQNIINVVTAGTIGIWFNPSSFDHVLTGKDDDTNSYIHIATATSIRIEGVLGLGAVTFAVPAMSTGTWYHIFVMIDSGNLRVFLNNVESSSGPQAFVGDSIQINQFGKYFDGSLSAWWNGGIDEAAFWNRVLAADERSMVYNGGSGSQIPFGIRSVNKKWMSPFKFMR